MKRWIAAGLVVIATAVLGGVWIVRLQRDIEALQEQLRATEQTSSGGAEIPVPELPAVTPQWRFPIADSDFLVLTSPYGLRVSPLLHIEMFHQGLDIAATWHAQVVAVADGVVVEHWPPPGTPYPGGGVYHGHPVYGGMVEIEHADGSRTLYAHMSWTRVHQGDRVQAGEVIGRIGATGEADGQHLHLEVHLPDGETANPLLYVMNPEQGEK